MDAWNPWHGCHRISPGCGNCYVYRRDRSVGRDAGIVRRTADFDLPMRVGRDGNYKLQCGREVFTCGTSDFFLEEADPWRAQAWRFIAQRPDVRFFIVTKRIDRFHVALPEDWGAGYDNVTIACTCENQDCVQQGEIHVDTYQDRILGVFVVCLPNNVTIEMVPAD